MNRLPNKMSKAKIKLIEVPSDLAGAKSGASMGINALKLSSLHDGSKYFEDFPSVVIQDENRAVYDGTPHTCAKYIDKVALVIERVAEEVKKTKEQALFPIVMAGDHSTCAGTMLGLKMAYPHDRIGVVYIDAHADFHTPFTSPSGNMHGMPLAIATDLDNQEVAIQTPSVAERAHWDALKSLAGTRAIDPRDIVFCALRDYEPAEAHLLEQYGIKNYSTSKITYEGVKKVVENIFEDLAHCDHIYVSFDVDSIDPLYIPGTGTPSDGGISFEQALQLNMELIKNPKVCCWESAEINPILDKQNISGKYSFVILDEVTKSLIENY
ncbi:arginase [Sulfurospirillum sp. 1612]|uniref:arginase n=1 Tax=Sulfurospirillum sp. 1612 TaxID=3094835 RepID=UPI002F931170